MRIWILVALTLLLCGCGAMAQLDAAADNAGDFITDTAQDSYNQIDPQDGHDGGKGTSFTQADLIDSWNEVLGKGIIPDIPWGFRFINNISPPDTIGDYYEGDDYEADMVLHMLAMQDTGYTPLFPGWESLLPPPPSYAMADFLNPDNWE